MIISVFGLGYVGAVTAACLTREGHPCIGVDVQADKVLAFQRGQALIVEPGLQELFADAHQRNLLSATLDPTEALARSEVTIICVGTPSGASGAPDLQHATSVIETIGNCLRANGRPQTLILRSTMLPGTTRTLVETHLADLMTAGRLTVFYYPEFLREGSAIADFRAPSLTVVGTIDGRRPEAIPPLFAGVEHWVRWEESELVKYTCNAFHATKVAFANEVGRIGKQLGVNSQRVMSLLCTDHVLNISPYYLRPGNPFGGSCLPKDVRALAHLGRTKGIELPLLSSLLPSNRAHLESLLAQIEQAGHRRVVILGLSFKLNTDDLRESSLVDVAQHLLGSGYDLRIYDPQLNLATLVGGNKRAIDIRLPHLARLLCGDAASAIAEPSTVVAAQRCLSLAELARYLTPNHHVIDVNGWPELAALPGTHEGFCW